MHTPSHHLLRVDRSADPSELVLGRHTPDTDGGEVKTDGLRDIQEEFLRDLRDGQELKSYAFKGTTALEGATRTRVSPQSSFGIFTDGWRASPSAQQAGDAEVTYSINSDVMSSGGDQRVRILLTDDTAGKTFDLTDRSDSIASLVPATKSRDSSY